MKTLTVFTPTYNRAHLLPRLYNSLCGQTSKDFIWMVIDDGSSDGTRELVERWVGENKIKIEYHYKDNGGMHTGHNLAYKLITTELNVCIDSDDAMPENAVALLIKKWSQVQDKAKIAGIIGLDASQDGKTIGTSIPENLERGSLHDLYEKYQVKGDKKIIIRTDLVRKYPPYPEYENEKLVPLGVLYLMMGKDYDFVYSNEVYCIVEYQDEGSSASILKQYRQSPQGFAYSRKIQIKYLKDAKNQIKNYIHLISSSWFANKPILAFSEVNPIKTILYYPLGLLLHFYLIYKLYQDEKTN